MITSLTAAFLLGVQENPAIPEQVKTQASVQLARGVPSMSDADLQEALDQAAVPQPVAHATLDVNRDARVEGLQSALTVLALFAAVGLFAAARRIPDHPQRSGARGRAGGAGALRVASTKARHSLGGLPCACS